MAWRVAKSLEKLLAQINAAAPDRDKSSDGGVGDAAHASRKSDHNPWVVDSKGVGIVTARDFTHDPIRGCDCQSLVDGLIASKDNRIKYIIWNYQIWNAAAGWRPYKGSNPHNHHAHVSVVDKPTLYDNERLWKFKLADPVDPPEGTPAPFEHPVLKIGDKRAKVEELQKLLGITVDGDFGEDTDKAVKKFQKRAGLVSDGIVGRYTWEKLLAEKK